MASWHPSQQRAAQAANSLLHSLSETSRQEAYREVSQSEGQLKAHVLTEDQGFQETFFLALGLGLGLVAVLLFIIMVSTPQALAKLCNFIRSSLEKPPKEDMGANGCLKARRSDEISPKLSPVVEVKLASML